MIDFSGGDLSGVGPTLGLLLLFSIPSLLLMVPLGFLQSAAARTGNAALRRVSRTIAVSALSLVLLAWLRTMPCWGKDCDYTHPNSAFIPILVTIVVAWLLVFVWINHLRISATE